MIEELEHLQSEWEERLQYLQKLYDEIRELKELLRTKENTVKIEQHSAGILSATLEEKRRELIRKGILPLPERKEVLTS